MKGMFVLNNRPEEWQAGMSITDLLEQKRFTFKMLVIKVNGELIKKKDYQNTIIPENADVKVIHLMSGG